MVKRLVNSGEKVILITYRNTNWPFSQENISIIDFTHQHRDYFVTEVKTISDWLKRRKYVKLMKGTINKIVNKDPFLLYIPNYSVHFQTIFAEHKYCQGYYFIEEGTLAYTPMSYLIDQFKHRPLKRKIKFLFGLTDRFFLERTDKFLGTISIREEAFSWNIKEKIVEPIPVLDNLNVQLHETIIITGFLDDNLSRIKKQLSTLLDYFCKTGIRDIAIKYHPHVYDNYPERIDKIDGVFKNYSQVNVTTLPQNYIVEYAILKWKSTIFSIDGLSSLNIYSILFGGHSFIVTCNSVKELKNMEQCLTYVTSK